MTKRKTPEGALPALNTSPAAVGDDNPKESNSGPKNVADALVALQPASPANTSPSVVTSTLRASAESVLARVMREAAAADTAADRYMGRIADLRVTSQDLCDDLVRCGMADKRDIAFGEHMLRGGLLWLEQQLTRPGKW